MDYSIFNEKNVLSCVDAGSENCPCYLALTGSCLTCTRLQGKEYCNCSWAGVCIYNEFIQSGQRINNPRKDFEAPIVSKKFYKGDLVVFVLDVGKGFALKASRPGSFVLIKGHHSSSFYDVPISIMKADVEKGQIHLAIKVFSAKTKALLLEDEKLLIRGPYRNGIQGVVNIVKRKAPIERLLIIAKGIGIAPGILASNYLYKTTCIDFVIDQEKLSKELISDYLKYDETRSDRERSCENDGIIKYLNFSDATAATEITELLEKNRYEAVIILTSDYYITLFGNLVKEILPVAETAYSNNFKICCGEGICGACSHETSNGEVIKMCKCNLSGDEVLTIKRDD